MMLTEDEAKKKDCPLGSLNVLAAKASGEVPSDYLAWCKCTASECMMWHWHKLNDERKTVANSPLGYCGLAGRLK